jgi:cation transport ATPase
LPQPIRSGKKAFLVVQKAERPSGIRTVMLTGDNRRTARAVAEQIELDEFQGELLPENKVAAVRSYEKELRTGGHGWRRH